MWNWYIYQGITRQDLTSSQAEMEGINKDWYEEPYRIREKPIASLPWKAEKAQNCFIFEVWEVEREAQ